jgi:coenzyme PQQ biosynthesis protein PqqD
MRLDDDQCPALVRGARLQSDSKTGEPMLLYPEGVIHLSETAYDIVRLCDGRTSLGVLVATLANHYEVEPSVIGTDVRECLVELIEQNLITL